jgi:hypothetical protein
MLPVPTARYPARPAQHGGRKNPPGNAAVEGQTPWQPLGGLQLAGGEAPATFQNAMPDFHAPAIGILVHPRERRGRCVDRPRRQQQPLDRGGAGGRRLCQRLYGPARYGGPPLTLTVAGRAQGQGTPPHDQSGSPRGLCTPPWPLDGVRGLNRPGRDGRAHT